MKRHVLLGVVFSFVVSPVFAGKTLVVDKNGGSPYVEIQAAVDGAQDGDSIFVKAGTYLPVTIDNRSLNLIGESPSLVILAGSASSPSGLQIRNLAPGKVAVARQLVVRGAAPAQPAAKIEDNLGSVRIEICDFFGKDGTNYAGPSGDGAWIRNSADLAFSHCHFFGGNGRDVSATGNQDGGYGGDGIEIRNASAAFYVSEMVGGRGGQGVFGGFGGDGAKVLGPESSALFVAHDTWFRGGQGGDATDWFENAPGSGGDGLAIAAGSTVHSLANQFFAGSKGQCLPQLPCYGGSAGATVTGNGQLVPIAGPSRYLDPVGAVVDGLDLSLNFHGQPGDQVILFVSYDPGFLWNLPWNGVRLISPASRRLNLGSVSTYDLSIPDSMVAPGQARRLVLQPVFRSGSGEVVLGNAQNLLVFDSIP